MSGRSFAISVLERFVIFTLGVDQPGIVAAVTGALFEQGCNLADCSMTILAGHFAMVLVVDSPSGVTGVETALEQPARTLISAPRFAGSTTARSTWSEIHTCCRSTAPITRAWLPTSRDSLPTTASTSPISRPV